MQKKRANQESAPQMPRARELINAARNADWAQVILNGGPPCFHYEAKQKRFCLRAERWFGHDGDTHKFVSLAELLERLAEEAGGQPQ